MKKLIILLSLFPFLACAQPTKPIDTTDMAMVPMSETYQRGNTPNGSPYYQRGSNEPYTGILYGRYDNGELMTMQEYVDGIGNGTWIQFNPDGSKLEQGTYINNRVEGPVTQYYEDGSIKAKGQYRHWKQPIGPWTYYDREGKVVHRMTYTP